MRDASEKPHQASPAPQSATEAPVRGSFIALPSDDALTGFLVAYPRRSLAQICKRFGVPYCYSAVRRSPDGMDYGYTPEAKRVALQLQRLRKARRIHCVGMRWEVW